jgi:hypothetical protein
VWTLSTEERFLADLSFQGGGGFSSSVLPRMKIVFAPDYTNDRATSGPAPKPPPDITGIFAFGRETRRMRADRRISVCEIVLDWA